MRSRCRDIIKELQKPGRDPREDMPKPILRSDVLDMKDLKEGMILKGTVQERDRFWGICGYRSSSGRPGSHLPADATKSLSSIRWKW